MPARIRLPQLLIFLSLTLTLAACVETTDRETGADDPNDDETTAVADSDDAPAEEATPTSESQEPTATPEATAEDTTDEADDETAEQSDRDEERKPFWMRSWENTDFENRTIDLDELSSGGVPPDGIPPIDEPKFIEFDEADEWLKDREPVVSIEIDGEARAYPLQIMTWHEIVNDEFGDRAVAVTFCPLCNSAVAFDRDVEGLGVVRFGVSGLLRKSDLVMWDDKTESFWQQITGEAIVGEMAGTQLTFLPSVIVSYEQFKETHTDGIVLSRDTGFQRTYGNNPYAGYDDIASSPFMLREESDDRFPPMERVLALELNDAAMAYPFSHLEEQPIVHDEVGGESVVIFWEPGATSALDQTSIADSREVGAAGAFNPVLNGDELTFTHEDGEIRDEQTGSTWNVLGRATSGELEGEQLEEHLSGTHFWFAWAAFQPETGVWSPE